MIKEDLLKEIRNSVNELSNPILKLIDKILGINIFDTHYLIVSQSENYQYNSEISIHTTLGEIFGKDLMNNGIEEIKKHIINKIGDEERENFIIWNIIKKGRKLNIRRNNG